MAELPAADLPAGTRTEPDGTGRPPAGALPAVGAGRPEHPPLRPRAARRAWAPLIALGGLIAGYVAVFGTLTWAQESNYGTFGYDMGIYDQGIWLLSRFETPFDTVRGLNYFGHHVNLVTLLFVPAYWLGAGPHFLYLAQTVWMALGAVPVWLLARDRLRSPWLALALAGAYLLYPALEWTNWWQFHPDALIITPLLFAYWLASRRRWGWFAVAVAVTLSCKEDAALAVAMLGLVIAVFWSRRAGLLTFLAGAAWFGVATKLIIPLADGGQGAFYQAFFPGFGHSFGQIAVNMITHPGKVAGLAFQGDRPTYYLQVLAPVGFVALAALPVLLIGGPQLLINVTSDLPYTHDIHYYYTSIIVAAVFAATVEACALIGRRGWQRAGMVGIVAACALLSNIAWSPSPISVQFRSGIWVQPSPLDQTVNRALRLVPADAGVSATEFVVPHLTHRVRIYAFPNPWFQSAGSPWGFDGADPASPSTVNWLVLYTPENGSAAGLYRALVGRGGPFRVVFSADGVVVARRVRPGFGCSVPRCA